MKCKVEGCELEVGPKGSNGMCGKHARREWGIRVGYSRLCKEKREKTEKCSIECCTNRRELYSEYCAAHKSQLMKHGRIMYEQIRKNTGRTEHYLYGTWVSMKDRCNNPRNRHYKNYGGRGISVCSRWTDHAHGFENFIEDMGERQEGCSLDRIDNNKGYSPENCRWADKSTQNLNKRNNSDCPFISTRMRGNRKQYCVRIKDLRDKTGKTVRTKIRKNLEEAIIARDELLKEMYKEGSRPRV